MSSLVFPKFSSSDSSVPSSSFLSPDALRILIGYWRATNYLCVGQIYLESNPLLRSPLSSNDIKPRLLGHWGTCPGLNLIYVHTNRLLVDHPELEQAIFLAGPGHGGPSLVANTYLEGSYSEFYPLISQDEQGLTRLFRQFSTPGGIPSHCSPQTPGSIHEGGELGYVLVHAFGAVMDNPDLLTVAVVGDGEAETGPLEGSWKGISFLNPKHDGAVLPILHLNGYKISGPTVLARKPREDVEMIFKGHGYQVFWIEGDDPEKVHQQMAETMEKCYLIIKKIQHDARSSSLFSTSSSSSFAPPRWPMIVLRTPKGWTGPSEVDHQKISGTFRAHQVPITKVKEDHEHLKILEKWMKSYKPEELFDENGRLKEEFTKFIPKGERRMGAQPAANGQPPKGVDKDLKLPELKQYAITFDQPGTIKTGSTAQFGLMLRDIYKLNPRSFRLFCPDETNSNRVGAVFEIENRCLVEKIESDDDHVSMEGRVMEVLSEHCCEGWLEGYNLTGRSGIFVTYEAFSLIVSSMIAQHLKWLATCLDLSWRQPVPSLNILLTSTCWRNDHNGFSHQGPGLIDNVISKQEANTDVYLPADANTLLVTGETCLKQKNAVNLIVIDKQPQLQYLTLDEAKEHFKAGASEWKWATRHPIERHSSSTSVSSSSSRPDLIFGCCGDVPTQETLAAVEFLHTRLPHLHFRVVNIINLMCMYLPEEHPHGMTQEDFINLWTDDLDVVMAFHGYPSAFHPLLHGRPNPTRFHVKGYCEHGTTTTPFDMVVLNRISRYHLVIEAVKRLGAFGAKGHKGKLLEVTEVKKIVDECNEMLRKHEEYIREKFEDIPEIAEWKWRGRVDEKETEKKKAKETTEGAKQEEKDKSSKEESGDQPSNSKEELGAKGRRGSGSLRKKEMLDLDDRHMEGHTGIRG